MENLDFSGFSESSVKKNKRLIDNRMATTLSEHAHQQARPV